MCKHAEEGHVVEQYNKHEVILNILRVFMTVVKLVKPALMQALLMLSCTFKTEFV